MPLQTIGKHIAVQIFPFILTALSALSAFAAETHCLPDEDTIFNCSMKGSSKTVSLCASRPLTKEKGYIQYRFGAPGKIELKYPSDQSGSQRKFTYMHYVRARVDRTELGFRNGTYDYSVFSDYEGDMKPVINESGLLITDMSTGKETKMLCRGKPSNRLGLLANIVSCAGEESSGECQ
ncbi:MAG: hypothetical protein HZB31_14115 [Nitrospirae bacterium]|nr:hypothetical protein [Nitrospirota bacterium]